MKLERIQLFLILAFAPIFAVFYFSPFSAVIPFYGFLLILLKHQKLSEAEKANPIQMMLGATVILVSICAYYAVVPFYPEVALYSPANYALHVLGLFLTFFKAATLKEAFSPLFLIVGATSSNLISALLKPVLSPFSGSFAYAIVTILRAIGIDASIYNLGRTPIITFPSLSGRIVSGAFVYECIGVYSMLVFSIILVVILAEDPSGLRVKLASAIIGLAGTFAMNILRVVIIFLADYFYGAEVGANVHYMIGYVLFSIWLTFFFFAYSKRYLLKRLWQCIGLQLSKRNQTAGKKSELSSLPQRM